MAFPSVSWWMRYVRCAPCVISIVSAMGWHLMTGCGPMTYTLDAGEAERVVAQAREENASYFDPYDLYFAEAQLDKAHEEAAQGRYEDAIHALAVALSHGRRALTRSVQSGLSRQ